MITSNITSLIKQQEGTKRDSKGRHILYRDTVGDFTIGYGYDLSANGISDAIAEALLTERLAIADKDCHILFKNFDNLSEARQGVLLSMAYQLGRSRLMGFSKFIAAVNNGDWPLAVKEMLDSEWARQVPARAQQNANIMERGYW